MELEEYLLALDNLSYRNYNIHTYIYIYIHMCMIYVLYCAG
jgi:hypothetical protein